MSYLPEGGAYKEESRRGEPWGRKINCVMRRGGVK